VSRENGLWRVQDHLQQISGQNVEWRIENCEWPLPLPVLVSSRGGLLEVVEIAGELVVRDAQLVTVPLDV